MIIFLVVLVTFGVILELLSLKDKFTNIEYSSVPSKLGCEPDEIFQIKTTVTNYSSRTISFLKMEEEFPKDIHLQNGEKVYVNGRRGLYTSALFVQKRQKITRTIQVSLSDRGLYFLEGCIFHSGDFLGIKENFKEIKQQEEIIIYPKALSSAKVFQALSGFYGDFVVKRFFIEDPMLVKSYNDYSGREPMRSISWTQSAKKNRLMVKEYDHTMDMSVTILLDVFIHWSEGVQREHLEYCYSLVRTIAEFLEGKKISYRLLSNTYMRSRNTVNEALEKSGQGSHHYKMLLNTLGQAESNTFGDISELYNMTISKYNGENTIFYVAPFINEKRAGLVENLHNKLGSQIYPMYATDLMEVDNNVV
jgi:hypothetical protein